MENITANVLNFWKGLDMRARIAIGIGALVVVGGMAAFSAVIKAPPRMAYLGSNFEQADAAKIVDELDKEGIEYVLENDGRDILVQPEEVNRLRLKLASKGLPKARTGYDLFDKSKLGVTETGMRIDFQRATQGELETTLESLEQVADASVFLNIAPDTSFLDSDAKSTASVVLSLEPGASLSSQQARTIKNLVSGAVTRLSEDEVTLTDQFGNALGGGDAASASAGLELTEAQRQYRKRVEKDLEEKILDVLDGGPYGIGDVRAVVSVDIDFRTVNSEREEFSPVVGDQGIEQKVVEHREKTNSKDSLPGGTPGTTSNIAGYESSEGGSGSGIESSKQDLAVDYAVNREVTQEALPPGSIVRRSATVALNAGEVWDEQIKASIEHMVGVAIGADNTKGDKIFVQAFNFKEQPEVLDARAGRMAVSRGFSAAAGWLIALIMVGLLMLMLRNIAQNAFPKESYKLALASAGEHIAESGGDTGQVQRGGNVDSPMLIDPLNPNSSTKPDQMRREIGRLIEENPDQVRNLLRTWMLQDR